MGSCRTVSYTHLDVYKRQGPRRGKQLQDIFPAVAPPSAIRFEDIAQKAGVHFVVENCPTPEKHQPETMPAGVALFDYDGDGLLDRCV